MLQEYFQRTFFVFLHGSLLLLYLVLLGRAFRQLQRERATLRHLGMNEDEEGDAGYAEQLDPQHLRQLTEEAPRTMLRRQLRAILRRPPTTENFDSQGFVAQLGRSLASTDDLIRFCINGLVIVGLVGTLYAFYHMWGGSRGGGGIQLTNGNSVIYLENMSTALLVSLVGLLLALITNFFFAILRSRRQAFLKEVAAFLTPIAALAPTDSKTHSLITQLLSPLNELVAQLTVQNKEVLRGLTEAVNTRTEQLNQVIDKAVVDWQNVIGVFRTETLQAVTSLQEATDRLAGSSTLVAGTMTEVSQALERTKDISRIVDQLEASSGQVIDTISKQLVSATDDWIAIHNLATKAYQSALEEQSKSVTSATRGMTGIIRADLSQMVAHALSEFDKLKDQLGLTLDGFSGKFAASQETISAKWMTEAAAVTDHTKTSLNEILEGWGNSFVGAQQTINTAFANSQELATEMRKSVAGLSGDIQALTLLAHTMSETSGAPIYLGQAVERLGQITEALETLSAKLEYGQTLHQLRGAIEANEKELVNVGRQMTELKVSQTRELSTLQEGSLGLATQLDGFDGRFRDINKKLTDVHSEIGSLSRQVKRSNPEPPPVPPTNWQRLRTNVGKMFKRNNAQTESSDGNSPADENTTTEEKSHHG